MYYNKTLNNGINMASKFYETQSFRIVFILYYAFTIYKKSTLLCLNLIITCMFYTYVQKEEAKTKGKNWFNLPATKLTDNVRHDLDLIRMRSALDTKRFYKKNETEAYPKYFQVNF